MSRSGFKDPIAVKEGKQVKSPFNFDCPTYDDRTACYINAGSHYGVGHTNPVGHEGNPKQRVDTLPYGVKQGMKVSEVPRKNLRLEIEE